MGANLINWDISVEDAQTIKQIVKREKAAKYAADLVCLSMDITATHLNGTPLDLKRLLEFDNFNFFHDIGGIMSHIDRTDGKLKRGFLPRCSK